MANPTLPHDTKKEDRDNQYLECEGVIVNGKVVVKAQESNIADAASTTLTATTKTGVATTLASNTGIKRVVAVVNCASNGTATEKVVFTLPARSFLLSLEGEVTTIFNGDTTQTYEVGTTGTTDLLLDPVDTDPTSINELKNNIGGTNNGQKVVTWNPTAVDVVLTYTNTANATTGEITVVAHYIELADVGLNDVDTQTAAFAVDVAAFDTAVGQAIVDLDLHKGKINSILTALENHGLLADA